MVITRRTFRYLPMVVAAILLVSDATVPPVRANELAATEQRLLADAADGSLDEFSLLEGALIASGVTDLEDVEHYSATFSHRVAEMVTAEDDEPTAAATAEQIYRFLHDEFLSGEYHSTCTEIDRALDDGDYNCVTATILYQCICQVHGLSPVAVATNTHVRSRLLDDQTFDVETTCREWFDVARRDPSSQTFRTKQQVTRPLSDVELLAKIYYNRGVSLLEKKAFEEAIALLHISRSLDPADLPTRENMAAGLNNWALAESDAGDFERAVELIEDGLRSDPEFAPLLANDVHVHQQWAVVLCERQQFAEALERLQRAYQRRPEVALFDRGRVSVLAQWAIVLFESGELKRATQLFAEASGWVKDHSDISRCRSVAVREAAANLARQGRTDEALRLERWGGEPD